MYREEKNTFGIGNTEKGKTKHEGHGFFSFLDKKLGLEHHFETGFSVNNLPKVLFVLMLGLMYIGNAHYSEESIRNISLLQVEVENLRADYITLKADLMFSSKQSEVAKRVQFIGLKESVTPPHKILIHDEEY